MDKIRLIGQLVLKVTSPCNLNCSYCYVYNAEDKLSVSSQGDQRRNIRCRATANQRVLRGRHGRQIGISFTVAAICSGWTASDNSPHVRSRCWETTRGLESDQWHVDR
jgi:hypothetical protein